MTPKLNYSIIEAAHLISCFPKLRGVWADLQIAGKTMEKWRKKLERLLPK